MNCVRAGTPSDAHAVAWDESYAVPGDAGVVVNATSIGLFPGVTDRPDIDHPTLTEGNVVADVIPNPPRTAFLAEAESRGCVTVDGLGMLVNQGIIAIRHWTGVDADAAIMRETLNDLFT